MTDATNTTAPENTTPVVPKTRREKLLEKYNATREKALKLNEDLAELASEINSIDLLASVGVGSAVIVSLGKGETARKERGVVIGVKEDDEGAKSFKVQYGSGFDTDVTVVKSGKIELPPAEELIAAAAEAEQAAA